MTELQEVQLLDRLTDMGLESVHADHVPAPAVVRFLLRQYAATGREDLEAALGLALARALDVALPRDGTSDEERSTWLETFLDATSLSDDERLLCRVRDLSGELRRGWAETALVERLMRSLGACIRAAGLQGDSGEADLLAASIAELERAVGATYAPGEGIAHLIGQSGRQSRTPSVQIAAASTLLTAYQYSGCLPYAMLAEELMLLVRTVTREPPEAFFLSGCEAVSVLNRLVVLHNDADYREAAVLAPEADYAADAERLLKRLAGSCDQFDIGISAAYGTALLDWQHLRTDS